MTENNVEEKNNAKNTSPFMVVGVIALVGLIGFGVLLSKRNNENGSQPSEALQKNDQASSASAQTSPTVAGVEDATIPSDVRTVEIEAGSFYYKPAQLRVKKGEKIKLILKSVDMMHDFNIDELGLKIPITKSGSTATVEFTADKSGTFEYYCSVGQHRLKGQVGKLIVE